MAADEPRRADHDHARRPRHPNRAATSLDILTAGQRRRRGRIIALLCNTYYILPMIVSFKDRDTERLFDNESVPRFEAFERVARRKLLMLAAAHEIGDLRRPPGNRLERLKGDREGDWSIRINDRYRLCFRWREGNAHDVEITDYHR